MRSFGSEGQKLRKCQDLALSIIVQCIAIQPVLSLCWSLSSTFTRHRNNHGDNNSNNNNNNNNNITNILRLPYPHPRSRLHLSIRCQNDDSPPPDL